MLWIWRSDAYANKDMAAKMTEKCLERSDAPYITYCMACRDRFAREGRESRHILELLYGANASNMPDISEKRYNRLILKQTLLKNIWNEEPIMEKKRLYCCLYRRGNPYDG